VRDVLDPAPRPEGLGLSTEDWHPTPVRVRLVMRTLLQRLQALAARLAQNSSTAS